MREYDQVFELVEELKKGGVAVIYITNSIAQVYYHSSRIVILEAGIKLGEFVKEETSIGEIEEVIRKGSVSSALIVGVVFTLCTFACALNCLFFFSLNEG